jgi:hypothetical protein
MFDLWFEHATTLIYLERVCRSFELERLVTKVARMENTQFTHKNILVLFEIFYFGLL